MHKTKLQRLQSQPRLFSVRPTESWLVVRQLTTLSLFPRKPLARSGDGCYSGPLPFSKLILEQPWSCPAVFWSLRPFTENAVYWSLWPFESDIYNIYNILEIKFFFTSGHQIDLAIGQTHLVLSRPLPNGLNCQVMPTPEMQKSCEKIFHI